MLDLSADNVVPYLQSRGLLAEDAAATAVPLAWGVSNVVLRVNVVGQPDLVIKQSRPQLRTKVEWFSRCERIYREADVLRALETLFPASIVPRVLFEDRPEFILGLSAIREDHEVWKQHLLEGRLEPSVAAALGDVLGHIHRETAGKRELLPDPEDWSLFDELRIDPFYRWIARRHAVIAPAIEALIDEMSRHRICLTLADFSPKNVLVHADGVSLVDFETGHYGDPAFDLGFFLSHIVLKSLRWPENANAWRALIASFWRHYRAAVDTGPVRATEAASTSARAVPHFAACLLARVDGKSTVDYLTQPWQAEFVRQVALGLLQNPPATLEHAVDHVDARLRTTDKI